MESESEKVKKMFSSAEKSRIFNVFSDFFSKIKKENVAVKKSAVALKVSERSVWRIIKEKKSSGKLSSPKKSSGRPSLIETLDEFDICAIRRKMHQYFFRNEIPTLDKIHKEIQNDLDLPNISRSGLYNILKSLNVKYVKRERHSLLIEKEEIINWRRKYIRSIKDFRHSSKKIYYLDETWINEGITRPKVWKDLNVASTSQARREGLSTGLSNPPNKGKRLIILHIGSEDGFVRDGLLAFESKKTGDYHEEMNAETFENWFSNILTKIRNESVIVMDNAPYHSRKLEKIPNMSWKKQNIQEWLLSKSLEFQEDMVKSELVEIVRRKKFMFDKYVVDEMAKAKGHTVLRLPPYHCELNPIEMIWAQVKGEVAKNNVTFKMNDVKLLFETAIKNIDAIKWENCVKHVIENVEKSMWEIDAYIDVTTEKLIINLREDSSETEYFDDSE